MTQVHVAVCKHCAENPDITKLTNFLNTDPSYKKWREETPEDQTEFDSFTETALSDSRG